MVRKPNQIKKIIRDFAASLKLKGIKVNRLILYGSYAAGKPGRDSDIDIAVISSSFNNKNLLKRQELLGEVIFGLGEPIEAIGYSYKEFIRRPRLSFLFDIVSNGKTVYQG
ncbi:MAG: nucleotidyltransferase domain-containing protein [Candidatus Omnitrophota bacterium]